MMTAKGSKEKYRNEMIKYEWQKEKHGKKSFLELLKDVSMKQGLQKNETDMFSRKEHRSC